MTTYPRRLERSRTDRMIGGVCGGLARYLNMEPTLVRILVAAVTVFTGGFPILLYLVALFVMPEEGSNRAQPPSVYPPAGGGQPYAADDFRPAPPRTADPVWGAQGAPWEQPEARQRPTPPPPPDQAEPPSGQPRPGV